MDKPLKKPSLLFRHRLLFIGAAIGLITVLILLILSSGGRKQRVEAENLQYAVVKLDRFLEYVEVEGVVHPILTLRVNTKESGTVDEILAEEGEMIEQGAPILTLLNPEMLQKLEDEREDWEKLQNTYKEKEIEMEQKSLNLKLKTIEMRYELERMDRTYALDLEEFNMGVISKTQLELKRAEFEMRKQTMAIQMQSLEKDSLSAALRRQMTTRELEHERRKFLRSQQRVEDLIVSAPITGQLSYIKVKPGQKVGNGENIGEIKVLEPFKIETSLSEYYIDRIVADLPAHAINQGEKFPLKITKIIPEVVDRAFQVDLVFEEALPENIRVGKNFRVQIELDHSTESIIIPKGDFFSVTGGHWIFRLTPSGNKAVRTPITIGRQNPEFYEVVTGLEPGDRVIVTGYRNFGSDISELILK